LTLRDRKWWEAGEGCIMRSCITFTLHKILLGLSRMRWVGQVVWMGEMRNTHRVLVGKPEGKRLFGRHRHRWEYNIRRYLKEMG
jgi:hypothetical protein